LARAVPQAGQKLPLAEAAQVGQVVTVIEPET
jgi:hypothetical protein